MTSVVARLDDKAPADVGDGKHTKQYGEPGGIRDRNRTQQQQQNGRNGKPGGKDFTHWNLCLLNENGGKGKRVIHCPAAVRIG